MSNATLPTRSPVQLIPPLVDPLMRRVADQVRPPSVDRENAICSSPVKRSSCHTT
ncbi:MAG TPA: hypothetical protein VFP78_07220 [Solirubrobacteraceae bacterium]|nr:hypothetical protein [Solirubrobacteraceae bacterium]